MLRNAKIVATIGPVSSSEIVLKHLIENGMDVARLNFSHGTYSSHQSCIQLIRNIAADLQKPVAILQDLQGPKLRVGDLPEIRNLTAGDVIEFGYDPDLTISNDIIPLEFPKLIDLVKINDRVLLDDGKIEVRVIRKTRSIFITEVITGGLLSAHKGINLPGKILEIPAFTEKDKADAQFGLDNNVDIIALSFVQSAKDLYDIKKLLTKDGEEAPLLIAKLERPVALDNLSEILENVDGVMVARGDLGVEMSPENVPGAQKKIIQVANRSGKLVITATQMLESMINLPLPTRAEASDVANAIFDGSDAVMLSEETAAGKYPLESLKMMNRIIHKAEDEYTLWGRGQDASAPSTDDSMAIALAARELAHDRDVEAIAVFTRTGRTAILMSKTRPCVPIFGFTPRESTFRRLALAWGVFPVMVPFANTIEEMIAIVERSLRESGNVKPGGQVVIISGYPANGFRQPNFAMLHTIQ